MYGGFEESNDERYTYLETMESRNQTVQIQPATVTPPIIRIAQGSGCISKGGRRSDVWRHFTLTEILDGKTPVDSTTKKKPTTYATCKYCGVVIKANSVMGTSTCRHHHDICKLKPKEGSASDNSISSFDQKLWLSKLATAIICHAYPLRIVEHEFCREEITYLNRNVKHVSRNIILRYCICEHDKCKAMLFDTLSKIGGKVSFTCDLWTSCTNRGYLTLTAHYVDND